MLQTLQPTALVHEAYLRLVGVGESQRAMISRATLARVEKGAPQVSLGIYATVLFILGLDRRVADLADVHADDIGLGLEEERLPQKIYLPRRKRETMP